MPQGPQGNDNRVKAKNFTNSGAYAPGGTANYTAAPVPPDTLELRTRLDELQRLLSQYADALPDAEELRQVTGELGAQLQQPEPNRTVVRSLLTALTTGAGGVTAVLAAVTGLSQFVNRFLH
ncbi:DUF5955 family protein [Streptomyces sp. NBC_01352]|uniref:Uncharacterized protein n=1 Tax=Streptomyces plumbiresistens TaxID=511811 RepID=A0ABP7RVH7_9ACTN|nr:MULTISPECIES: DUF5955 family protein [unclassified Streptomyces]MCX4699157.1 DUF5955 family protein [Streptomyces sp. NBC_01373]